MATKKTSYPTLPKKHWRTLREKFKQSIPGTVTARYLAAVLNMEENFARANVLPPIQRSSGETTQSIQTFVRR